VHQADHSPQSSVDAKNEWKHVRTPYTPSWLIPCGTNVQSIPCTFRLFLALFPHLHLTLLKHRL